MKVSKDWLERKIKELNDWLSSNHESHSEYKLKVQNRNYYVDKICELEDNRLNEINV
jgi:cytolysin (calcineurin-like family phosphatase)